MSMKSERAQLLVVLLTVASLAVAAARLSGQDLKHTTDIAVVVNPDNTLTDIRLPMLRKIVLGEQTTWGNHVSINLIVRQEGTPEQQAMLRALAQMDQSQFRQSWVAKVFRGEAPAEPVTVPSSGLASEYVVTHRGAIAFVRGIDLRKDLKVLKVEGLLPGAPGYALR
jgi:hypothetical protein